MNSQFILLMPSYAKPRSVRTEIQHGSGELLVNEGALHIQVLERYKYTSIGMPGIKLALLKACMNSHHSRTAPQLQNAVFACAVKTTNLSLF